MKRRDIIKALGLSPLWALRAEGHAAPLHRVRPGDPAWPTTSDWARLGRRLKGALIRPAPILEPCLEERAGAACALRLREMRNPYFLGDQPAGTQVSGWLDAWTPEPSAYAVAAESARDVAEAVQFARRRNLRVVVKGGGHSYQGTSNAPDSLLIWTRRMNRIELSDAFTPEGCEGLVPPSPAVTVESGAMWMDVYDAVTTRAGRYVQGGGCATVGVAGLVQSGGFGSFSKRFGLAAAGLLEAEIVTADGQIRRVNRRRDPELFWALKGGGGGTFGVVTKLTLRTHELPELFGGMDMTIRAKSDAAFETLLERFVATYAESLFNPHWGESVTIRPDNRLQVSMVCAGLDADQIQSAWRPFVDGVRGSAEYVLEDPPSAGAAPARRWWDVQYRRSRGSDSVVFDDRPDAPATHAWWSGDQDQVSAFLWGYDSVWLPAYLLQAGDQSLAKALFAASRASAVQLHFNKGLAGAPADVIAAARDTATNPQVTQAFALAIVAAGGPPALPGLGPAPDLGAARRSARQVAQATAELRKVAPGSGSYVSESDYFNRDWRTAFWGSHYRRLLAVKREYDPAGLFTVHHGVGSELWSADGFTRR